MTCNYIFVFLSVVKGNICDVVVNTCHIITLNVISFSLLQLFLNHLKSQGQMSQSILTSVVDVTNQVMTERVRNQVQFNREINKKQRLTSTVILPQQTNIP